MAFYNSISITMTLYFKNILTEMESPEIKHACGIFFKYYEFSDSLHFNRFRYSIENVNGLAEYGFGL